MHQYTAVVERCTKTGFYVGYIRGFAGARSQGETLDELNSNSRTARGPCNAPLPVKPIPTVCGSTP